MAMTTSKFLTGMLTGVAAGAAIYVAGKTMKNTVPGKKLERNIGKTMKDVGSVMDHFTAKFH